MFPCSSTPVSNKWIFCYQAWWRAESQDWRTRVYTNSRSFARLRFGSGCFDLMSALYNLLISSKKEGYKWSEFHHFITLFKYVFFIFNKVILWGTWIFMLFIRCPSSSSWDTLVCFTVVDRLMLMSLQPCRLSQLVVPPLGPAEQKSIQHVPE